jgi:hypothetical protein
MTEELRSVVWHGNNFPGSVYETEPSWILQIGRGESRVHEVFNKLEYGGSDDAREAAVYERSLRARIAGIMPPNQWRRITHPVTGESWLQVRLTRNKFMLVDEDDLHYVEAGTWHAVYSNGWYSRGRCSIHGEKKAEHPFHMFITKFVMCDHVNGRYSRTIELTSYRRYVRQPPQKPSGYDA